MTRIDWISKLVIGIVSQRGKIDLERPYSPVTDVCVCVLFFLLPLSSLATLLQLANEQVMSVCVFERERHIYTGACSCVSQHGFHSCFH